MPYFDYWNVEEYHFYYISKNIDIPDRLYRNCWPRTTNPVINNAIIPTVTSTLLQRMARPFVVIAIDGSLYEFHPRFRPLMTHMMSGMAPECKVRPDSEDVGE